MTKCETSEAAASQSNKSVTCRTCGKEGATFMLIEDTDPAMIIERFCDEKCGQTRRRQRVIQQAALTLLADDGFLTRLGEGIEDEAYGTADGGVCFGLDALKQAIRKAANLEGCKHEKETDREFSEKRASIQRVWQTRCKNCGWAKRMHYGKCYANYLYKQTGCQKYEPKESKPEKPLTEKEHWKRTKAIYDRIFYDKPEKPHENGKSLADCGCASCKKHKQTLGISKWRCDECGEEHDWNAGKEPFPCKCSKPEKPKTTRKR